MDVKKFVLSYYKDSAEDFHIHKVTHTVEAKKPHTHEYFQIYYVEGGSIVHYVENGSSVLNQGDMFIVPSNTAHYISAEDGSIFYSFSFMPSFLGGQSKLVQSFLTSLGDSGRILPKVSADARDVFFIENVMERMTEEFTSRPIGYADTVRAYAVMLVTVLARNYFEKSKVSDCFENSKQYVLHCIKYVEESYHEPLTLDEMARRSAMSRGSFCTLFKSLTGHTFNSYLNHCRIKKAAEYIRNGYAVTAVCGLCGYNDFSTFYRNFKKIMNVSPLEYKRLLQHNDEQVH